MSSHVLPYYETVLLIVLVMLDENVMHFLELLQ